MWQMSSKMDSMLPRTAAYFQHTAAIAEQWRDDCKNRGFVLFTGFGEWFHTVLQFFHNINEFFHDAGIQLGQIASVRLAFSKRC